MKLENKTVEELKNMCRNKKISGYSKLNKQGLINLLNNNKKGGEFPKNWMQCFNNKFQHRTINGYTHTKNSLASNVFVPFKEYDLDEIPNNATKNNISYPIINMMIFDYLYERQKKSLYERSVPPKKYKNEKKITKLKNIIQEYVPINNTSNNTSNTSNNIRNNKSTKRMEKSVCKWWCLDSNLNFKEIYGQYIAHGFYQLKHKNFLPPSFKDYDGFLIVHEIPN
jgi:hypothetical protein